MSKSNKKSIYVGQQLSEAIGVVGPRDLSSRLNRIGDRYMEILRRQQIAKRFSEAELNLLKDSLNGVLHEPAGMIRGVAVGIQDSIELDGLAEKWEVDGPALIAKLQALDYVAEVALVEYVEAYWARVSQTDEDMEPVEE
ncbi:hypothetical protein D3C87_656010 [compost metagenome]